MLHGPTATRCVVFEFPSPDDSELEQMIREILEQVFGEDKTADDKKD